MNSILFYWSESNSFKCWALMVYVAYPCLISQAARTPLLGQSTAGCPTPVWPRKSNWPPDLQRLKRSWQGTGTSDLFFGIRHKSYAKLHRHKSHLFVRIEVAQNAGLRHVEVINGDEAFYPQPMKDYGELSWSYLSSRTLSLGVAEPPS